MVSTASDYDFTGVIDGFFAQKKIDGRHSAAIQSYIRERAHSLLAHPDMRYMPVFKILDFLAALVNIGTAVAEASQLRPNEVRALLRESLSDTAPLIHQFLLDAALERARYQPMMLQRRASDATTERLLLLQQRWAAMRAIHQEHSALPDAWIELVDHAVDAALNADEFQHYRQGPLLQFFSEMLTLARKLHSEGATVTMLEDALHPQKTLWKRYALKSARFEEKDTSSPAQESFAEFNHSRIFH